MNTAKVFILENCDYSTSHSIQVIQRKIQSLLFVLTPHKSHSSDIKFVKEAYKKTGTGHVKITPRDFIKKAEDCTHLFIEDYDLMEAFGYSESLNKIKGMGYNFVYLNKKGMGKTLNFNKYTIKSSKNDFYYYLYTLYIKYPDSVVICRNIQKIKLFCEVLGIKAPVDSHYKDEYQGKICFVVEEYKEIEASVVIYIGMGDYKVINITDNGKIKYRIDDLVRSLSRDVVSGRRKINYSRFRDIQRQ